MARTKILVPPEKQCGYTSVIVSYSTGIDSTGAIYWATQNFAPEKIFLLYCDTGAEYSVNEALFFKTAKVLGLKPILLKAPKDFLYLLLNERLKFPDSKNRWCTAYLKTAVTDHWIRTHRDILGEKCLFISGERRDESRGRAKLPERLEKLFIYRLAKKYGIVQEIKKPVQFYFEKQKGGTGNA